MWGGGGRESIIPLVSSSANPQYFIGRSRRGRSRRRRRDCVPERSSRLSERVRPKDKKVQDRMMERRAMGRRDEESLC